jgi:hypothetical protein
MHSRRRILPILALAAGGLLGGRTAYGAAASVSMTFPPDMATQDTTTRTVKWNKSGNRCQYSCTNSGPTDVGMAAQAKAFVVAGSTAPVIEVLRDGRIVARTTAAAAIKDTNSSDGTYDVYDITISNRCATTKVCSGGSNDGGFCTSASDCPGFFTSCGFRFCSNDQECNRPAIPGPGTVTDSCLLCDGAVCSDTAQAQLCPLTCTSTDPTKSGIECTSDSQCGTGGTCQNTGCRVLKNCATGTGGNCTGFTGLHDCSADGAPIGGPSDPNAIFINFAGAAPLHTVTAQVIGFEKHPGGGDPIGPAVVGASQNVIRMAKTTGTPATCNTITYCAGSALTTTGLVVPQCN